MITKYQRFLNSNRHKYPAFTHLFSSSVPFLSHDPKGTFLFCSLVRAPTQPQAEYTAILAILVEGKLEGRINQISRVSQMIHFHTFFPDTH